MHQLQPRRHVVLPHEMLPSHWDSTGERKRASVETRKEKTTAFDAVLMSSQLQRQLILCPNMSAQQSLLCTAVNSEACCQAQSSIVQTVLNAAYTDYLPAYEAPQLSDCI